ncbi:MAG: AAA family ATPase [Nanoarchaeota archaeon]
MIIGVAGPLAVGKDTVADILVKKGFVPYSYGNILRSECEKQGLPKDIPTLVRIGDELRAKDPAILSKMILEEITQNHVQYAVVSGIRAPAEAHALKNHYNFLLIWLDAPIYLRYQRTQASRRDERDDMSFEEFKERERQQMYGIGTQINLGEIRKLADLEIVNNTSIESLQNTIEALLCKLNGDN